MYSSSHTVLFSGDASKSKQATNLKNIVSIVASCIGLIVLVTIALLIRTVIKRKTMRDSRKHLSREIPPDYDMVKLFETCWYM